MALKARKNELWNFGTLYILSLSTPLAFIITRRQDARAYACPWCFFSLLYLLLAWPSRTILCTSLVIRSRQGKRTGKEKEGNGNGFAPDGTWGWVPAGIHASEIR